MKKSGKRFLSAVLCLLMLVSAASVSAFAASTPPFAYMEEQHASYSSLAPGSEVRIPVYVRNIKPEDYLGGFGCYIYENEYLGIKSVEFAPPVDTWQGFFNANSGEIQMFNPSASSDTSACIFGSGLLFTIVCDIVKPIPAGTKVNIIITDVDLAKTFDTWLNSSDPTSPPTPEEAAASIVYMENGAIYVPPVEPTSFTVNVSANPTEVYGGETVTVEVSVTGGRFEGAFYSLSYEKDKFELLTKPADAIEQDGTFDHTYIGYMTPDGTVIGKYTFRAIPQSGEAIGTFTLGEYAIVETSESSVEGNESPVSISAPAVVHFRSILNTLTVSANDVYKRWDGKAYGVTAAANLAGATIRYMDANGEYTLTESPKFSDIGEYVVKFKASLAGYADAFGQAKVVIDVPEFVCESTEYVPGYSLVLVYSDFKNGDIIYQYDGQNMFDVTAAGYVYNGVSFSHVYGIVVKGFAAESKISGVNGKPSKIGYSCDVNVSNAIDLKDVVNTISIYNADSAYMKYEQMPLILRADVDHSKNVNVQDTAIILSKIDR